MPRQIKINPEIRKRAVARKASIAKKLIEVKSQRTQLTESLREVRQREARFRTTAKRLAKTLQKQNVALDRLTKRLETLQDTVIAIKGDISARKLRKKPTSATQLAILSKKQKEIPTTRRQISALKRAIKQNETSQRANGNNLRAAQTEVGNILKSGERINARLKKLTGN
ncbi:MAG: hypothetical protein HON47_03150 [Candidatus Diapherotrites archaeon]|uniref:Uncharacterized protein n=1 Tax=Candidatus Iainarchaeum sp. TaxID=3101447 RepID=A0A8T5GEW4_9ARCH|nr:hypothetical protein [Candidatus Diapherotrites archaeon]